MVRGVLSSLLCGGLLASACAHSGDETGITTIRSGVPAGPRVTNVSPDDRATRLALELCRRAESCGRVGGRDQRWPTESACIADVETDMPARIGRWTCPADASRARFENCLAAIRSSTCETQLDSRLDGLTACRAEVVCGQP